MGAPPPPDLPPPPDAPPPLPPPTFVTGLSTSLTPPAAPAFTFAIGPPSPDLPTPADAPALSLNFTAPSVTLPQVALSGSAALTLPGLNATLPQISASITTPTFTLPPLGIKLDFALGFPGLSFCGFGIPGFTFPISFSLQLPSLSFPPQLFFGISLSCDLSRPFSADFGVNGGRVATLQLNEDLEYPD